METYFLQFGPIIAIMVPLVNAQYTAGPIACEQFLICDLICYSQEPASGFFSLLQRCNRGKPSDSGHRVGKRLRQSLTHILRGLTHFDSTVTQMLSVAVPHACLQLQQPDSFTLFNLLAWVMEFSFKIDSILGIAARFQGYTGDTLDIAHRFPQCYGFKAGKEWPPCLLVSAKGK